MNLEEPQMNLTPLIDVVFVILIMFIVVAPLLEVDEVSLAPGPPMTSEKAMAPKESGALTIHVYADDTIALNNQPLPLELLQGRLVAARQLAPGKHPQVFHDRNARFGTYQAVKNAVEAAGFSEMDVILKPQ